MATEEQQGYQDAIRQVHKALERRKHHLLEQDADSVLESGKSERQIRISEIDHIIEVLRTLHR